MASASSDKKHSYDAVVVLGGGLMKRGGEYYPADYRHSDEFGMLGGHMRVHAAIILYLDGEAEQFLFTTGVYEKNKKKFGPDVPPESSVYAARFREALAGMTRTGAHAIVEETMSTTTLENIRELLSAARRNGWTRAAVVTSEYHVPRVQALLARELKTDPVPCGIEILSAERIVKSRDPGVYDAEIESAYASPEAQQRAENEKRGLADIAAGRYAAVEYQLRKK